MVNRLCELYGSRAEVEIGEGWRRTFYDFPSLEQLRVPLPVMEKDLRDSGFGYRATHITGAVRKLFELEDQRGRAELFEGESRWLEALKSLPYEEARVNLLQFPGVGPKVWLHTCYKIVLILTMLDSTRWPIASA